MIPSPPFCVLVQNRRLFAHLADLLGNGCLGHLDADAYPDVTPEPAILESTTRAAAAPYLEGGL